jgi:nucleoside-diphosphate-sugar epimerase
MTKVAIFGATGFVGTAVAELLLRRNDMEVSLFSRGYGSAWRFARAGIPLQTVDVTSPDSVQKALAGATHVVNCTRGPREVMIGGLKNLLAASKKQGVKRFIHLSSMAVYGERPAPEAEHEFGPARPAPRSYGAEKLQQDHMVERATASGLDCVVICPPNISGVYSSFLCNLVADMRAGRFALVEGGKDPLNCVDVENCAHAVGLALQIRKGDGKRIFVSDGEDINWADLAETLRPLAELPSIPNIPASRLPATARRNVPLSVWRSIKHLVSSDVREALRRDPLLAKVDECMRNLAAIGGKRVEDTLRLSIEGAIKVPKVPDPNPYSSRYNRMQLRGVCHRIGRAREVLGYRPILSFGESMARFRAWYDTMYGFGEDYWPLAAVLMDFRIEPVPLIPVNPA